MDYLFGLVDTGIPGYALYTIIVVEITILGVTLYLHRDQAHRGVDLHPAIRHFFRFWIWCTSGMLTREWVSVHRKHHARCETPDDPHSPQVLGLKKVLLEGAELYQVHAHNPETLEKYGRGTPDDWLERNIYLRFPYMGLMIMLAVNLLLFGVVGLTIWAIQMASMPLLAAGIVNGVGHYSGYRNFECNDAARNIVPWGIFLGGEELHNNHHAFPASSKFSARWWEFDIGWMVIRILETLGLAKIRRTAPHPVISATPHPVDIETLKAVIVNRMHVLRAYSRQVTLPVVRHELEGARDSHWQQLLRKARKLLVRQPALLDASSRARLSELLDNSQTLRTVHEYREQLQAIWAGANVSNERLLSQLREWCTQAEASGIRALQEFAERLSRYQLAAQNAPA